MTHRNMRLHPHPRLHIALSILRAIPLQTSSSYPVDDYEYPVLHVFDQQSRSRRTLSDTLYTLLYAVAVQTTRRRVTIATRRNNRNALFHFGSQILLEGTSLVLVSYFEYLTCSLFAEQCDALGQQGEEQSCSACSLPRPESLGSTLSLVQVLLFHLHSISSRQVMIETHSQHILSGLPSCLFRRQWRSVLIFYV